MAETKQTQTGMQGGNAQSVQNQGEQQTQVVRGTPGREGLGRPGLLGALSPVSSPFALIRRMTEEMDRLFEEMTLGHPLAGMRSPRAGYSFMPQIEMFQRNHQLVVRADLPGMTKEDIRVELLPEALLIEGERKEEHVSDERGVYRSERTYGEFRRLIPVPQGVKTENVQVFFRNGVLEVLFELPEGQRGRRLEIRDEPGTGGTGSKRPTA